jgi:hypothetical protein
MVVTVETESANPKPKPKAVQPGAGDRGDPTDDYRKKMEEMGKVPQGAATNAGQYVQIPAKYATKDKSPLHVTLTKGSNENNFDLTD